MLFFVEIKSSVIIIASQTIHGSEFWRFIWRNIEAEFAIYRLRGFHLKLGCIDFKED